MRNRSTNFDLPTAESPRRIIFKSGSFSGAVESFDSVDDDAAGAAAGADAVAGVVC